MIKKNLNNRCEIGKATVVIWLLMATVAFASGCGGDSASKPEDAAKSAPASEPNGGPGSENGGRTSIFDAPVIEEELREARNLFINEQSTVTRSAPGYVLWNILTASEQSFPLRDSIAVRENIPRIDSYNPHPNGAILAGKIPTLGFKNNLPEDIKAALRGHELETLDIFVNAQPGVEDPKKRGSWAKDSSLKTHFWIFPHIENEQDIYALNHHEIIATPLAGIYHADAPADTPSSGDKSIAINSLEKLKIHLHAKMKDGGIRGFISPDNGHIHVGDRSVGISFYSVVVHEQEHRAAVTLHYLMNFAEEQVLTRVLQAAEVAGEDKSQIPQLLLALEAELAAEHARGQTQSALRSFFEKLQALLRLS